MRKILFLSALIVALFACGALAQEKTPAVDKVPEKTNPVAGEDPFGMRVSVPLDVLLRFSDEPGHHFTEAHEAFLKKDYAKSAGEIRTGAGFMKLELTRAIDGGRDALDASSTQLEKLADNVQSGSVTSVNDITATFAEAEQALALHHELKAEESWQDSSYIYAGRDLKASAEDLKSSYKFAGEKIDPETQGAIKDAVEIADLLIEGTPPPDARIGASMGTLGDKIDAFGSVLEQKQKK